MTYFLDVECYPNYFLVGLKKLKSGYIFIENNKDVLKNIIRNNRIVTFNGVRYDFPMVAAFLDGLPPETLYKISKNIIENKITDEFRKFKNDFIYKQGLELVDLIDIAPGVMVSLKMYGARMGYKDLMDLPYDPDTVLDKNQMIEIKNYNKKDLDITEMLYQELKDKINLRQSIMDRINDGQNLFIKGDASLGEYLVIKDLKKNKSYQNNKVIYNPPSNISFNSPLLKEILDDLSGIELELDNSGKPILKGEVFKKDIKIGNSKYKIGLGGLHSQEKDLITSGDRLYNADVTSFYPSLILKYGFKPSSYGDDFLSAYSKIYSERISAKKKGDDVINSAYKLALNSVFGKLGNKYSPLYDPTMLINVTLTGQLLLLRLIEMLEEKGVNVISSNTDGVEFQGEPGNVLKEWENFSGMSLEFNSYNKLYARDVNNYIAIWGDKTKSKGIYSDPDLKKSWEHPIVYDSIKEYLLKNTPIEKTIKEEKDLRKFLIIRNVTGGCVYNGKYKGRVARWYYSKKGDVIRYAKNDNKVAKSDNAMFLERINSINKPSDLDEDYYIDIAKSIFPINKLIKN